MSIISELEILLRAVNFSCRPVARKDIDSDINGQRFIRLARQHGLVEPALGYCKVHYPNKALLIERLGHIAANEAFRAERLNSQLVELSGSLSQSGVEHALIKGPAINQQFYASPAPSYRPCIDLDLLVPARSLPETIKCLEASSYRSLEYKNPWLIAQFVAEHERWVGARDMGFVCSENTHDVDLHWRVAHEFSLPFNTDELLSKSEHIGFNGLPVPVLEFKKHFILICIHGYLDHFYRLKHLADVFFAIHHPRFEELEILKLADSFGVRAQVADSIEAARYFFLHCADPKILDQQRPFIKKTYGNLLANDGFPKRIQSRKSGWSALDKCRYICRQIQTRSRKSSALAPLLNRIKLQLRMLDRCENLDAKWPLFVLFQLWFKRWFS